MPSAGLCCFGAPAWARNFVYLVTRAARAPCASELLYHHRWFRFLSQFRLAPVRAALAPSVRPGWPNFTCLCQLWFITCGSALLFWKQPMLRPFWYQPTLQAFVGFTIIYLSPSELVVLPLLLSRTLYRLLPEQFFHGEVLIPQSSVALLCEPCILRTRSRLWVSQLLSIASNPFPFRS